MAKVFIAESSYLVRKGMVKLLEQLTGVTRVHVADPSGNLLQEIKAFHPDLLLLNAAFSFSGSLEDVLAALPREGHIIQIVNGPLTVDAGVGQISIFEDKATLIEKINSHLSQFRLAENLPHDSEELTPREKLILKHVALGHTNKEIAAQLFISTHTVISHRKNITRKLEIKTVSGLTVYAILNNIIKIEDIT